MIRNSAISNRSHVSSAHKVTTGGALDLAESIWDIGDGGHCQMQISGGIVFHSGGGGVKINNVSINAMNNLQTTVTFITAVYRTTEMTCQSTVQLAL